MAAKNGTSKAAEVQAFVKEQLEEAQKRIQAIEGEAQKALQGLVKRLGNPTVKKLGQRAGAAGSEMWKHLDSLQNRMIEASGMATQSQLRELNREIHKLSRKVDTLVKGKPEVRS